MSYFFDRLPYLGFVFIVGGSIGYFVEYDPNLTGTRRASAVMIHWMFGMLIDRFHSQFVASSFIVGVGVLTLILWMGIALVISEPQGVQ